MERCQDIYCNKRLIPIANVNEERFYLQCDTCLEYFCPDHCDVDDDDGTCECLSCIETRRRKERS